MTCYSNDTPAQNLVYPTAAGETHLACGERVRTPLCEYHDYIRETRHRFPVQDEIDVFAPDGSTFTINYTVADAAGHWQSVQRVVEIEDTRAPVLRPLNQGNTVEFVRRDGVAEMPWDPYDLACASTMATRFTG